MSPLVSKNHVVSQCLVTKKQSSYTDWFYHHITINMKYAKSTCWLLKSSFSINFHIEPVNSSFLFLKITIHRCFGLVKSASYINISPMKFPLNAHQSTIHSNNLEEHPLKGRMELPSTTINPTQSPKNPMKFRVNHNEITINPPTPLWR